MAQKTEYTKKKEFEVKALPMEEKKRLVRDGKAHWFFPHHITEQVIICGVVVMILIMLSTLVPAHLGPKADPFDTPSHIKPEWYFLAAFYSLKFAQNLEFLGAWAPKLLGIAMQGVAVTILLVVPFIDFGGKDRNPSRRPIAMTLGAIGAAVTILFSILGAIS
jgi:quinol-cytochrome oxidoreductase complex cytochrome b subunit